MAESLIFHYIPGKTCLHRTDVRIKLIGMICLSLLLISVNVFKLILIFPLLAFLQLTQTGEKQKGEFSPFFLIMPLIIFTGNILSLTLSGGETLSAGFLTALIRTLRFIYILWIAHLFTLTTDPLTITPSFHFFLKRIPFIPAGRISTQMGLSLTLIPLILDEMAEIRDAIKSRCGWKPHRPLRNLVHMGIPLLEGVLRKAEELSDAMESRLYSEDATEPEILSGSLRWTPALILFLLIFMILGAEMWPPTHNILEVFLQNH